VGQADYSHTLTIKLSIAIVTLFKHGYVLIREINKEREVFED